MSERIARILRPHNITVAHKPSTTLRDVLTKVKDPSPINSRAGAVYEIPCAECPASYVGETGRTLECRIKEHKRSIANEDTRVHKGTQGDEHSGSSHVNQTPNELGGSRLFGLCSQLSRKNVS